jgi:hypothetical protein
MGMRNDEAPAVAMTAGASSSTYPTSIYLPRTHLPIYLPGGCYGAGAVAGPETPVKPSNETLAGSYV